MEKGEVMELDDMIELYTRVLTVVGEFCKDYPFDGPIARKLADRLSYELAKQFAERVNKP